MLKRGGGKIDRCYLPLFCSWVSDGVEIAGASWSNHAEKNLRVCCSFSSARASLARASCSFGHGHNRLAGLIQSIHTFLQGAPVPGDYLAPYELLEGDARGPAQFDGDKAEAVKKLVDLMPIPDC